MIHPLTRQTRTLLGAIAAALSIGLAATLVLPAAAAAAANTRVTIVLFNDEPNSRDNFQGYVYSAKGRCVDRKVKLLRKRPGRDARVGSDRHVRFDGVWVIKKEDPPDGRYYAKVKRKRGCQKDRSKTKVVDDNPQT